MNNNNHPGQGTETTTNMNQGPVKTKTCILHKDERGFGLKVSGSNPVFVAEVKAGGSAQKAGVCKNDIIFKVNGNLATKWPHEKVVDLIQNCGGPYVCLTLIVNPPDTVTAEATSEATPSTLANNLNQPSMTTNGTSGNNNTPLMDSNKNVKSSPSGFDASKSSVAASQPKASVPQIVHNIIPKHLAENQAKNQQQSAPESKNVSITGPFPLVPHPTVSPPGGHRSSSFDLGSASAPRKGSAPSLGGNGPLIITAPLPASPEVQAGLEKSRDQQIRKMIKTQKGIILKLKQEEEAARKEGTSGTEKVASIMSNMEDAENTIKVLKKRLKNMQRNRNKQKAEMSLFPSSTYFDTSASTTHLLASGLQDSAATGADGNLNPAFLGPGQDSSPLPGSGLSPVSGTSGDSTALLWGQRPGSIPHLANPAMIHRRRSGGEGIKERPKTRPKDWFRDDHLLNRNKKQLDILHFESDHEDDGTGPVKESAFSDQPGLDMSGHNVLGPGHGDHSRTDGVLLRSSKGVGAKGVSSAAQRSKSSLSSLFQIGKKSSNLPSSRTLLLSSSQQFQLLDTSPSTTDSDDSDLMSSSSSSSSDTSSVSSSDSSEGEEEDSDGDLRRRRRRQSGTRPKSDLVKSSDEGHSSQNSDLMKLDEDEEDVPATMAASREGKDEPGTREDDEELFHSANSDDQETKNRLTSSDLTATVASSEDRMKRRINKRRTSNQGGKEDGGAKSGRGGSSGLGSSNEDSIGSKERKQIAQVISGHSVEAEGGRKKNEERKTGSNVSTTSTASSVMVEESKKEKKKKNLSNVSQVSSASDTVGHHHRKRSQQDQEHVELSPEESIRRRNIRKNLKQRRLRMREMIKTEKTFGNQLKLLHDLFYIPLKNDLIKKEKSPPLNQVEMETLFANLLPLIDLHKQLYKFFKVSIKPLISSGIKRDRVDYELIGQRLVDIFTTLRPRLVSEFAFYCSNWDKQKELLASKRGSSKFAQFLKTAESSAKELLNKLSLNDLVMAPVQRIMRYRLLIHAVLDTYRGTMMAAPVAPKVEDEEEEEAEDASRDQSVEREERRRKRVEEVGRRRVEEMERRRRRVEEIERKGKVSLETAYKLVQEIARSVDDKKAESDRLEWIQKQLFPNPGSNVLILDSSGDHSSTHSRIIPSMDSLILEHEGPVDWKVPTSKQGGGNLDHPKTGSEFFVPVHLLLLRDFIVALSVSDHSGTSSNVSSLSPSSSSVSSNNGPSNRHSSLVVTSGQPMSLACLSKALPSTAQVSLAKLGGESDTSNGNMAVIPITTDLVVKPVAAIPKAFYLISTGKTKILKPFMYEIWTPDVEKCSKWIQKIGHLIRFKSTTFTSSPDHGNLANLVRLAPSTTPPGQRVIQPSSQFTPHPRFRHGIHRHSSQQQPVTMRIQGPQPYHVLSSSRTSPESDQNEVNKQRLAQLRNRPLPPPPSELPTPSSDKSSKQPPVPTRSDSIPGTSVSRMEPGQSSGPRFVGRIEVMEKKEAVKEFRSSIKVTGPIQGNNDSYNYRFNSDPGLVNNDYYFCLPVHDAPHLPVHDGSSDLSQTTHGDTFDTRQRDVLIEINQSILGLLLKKQQIIASASTPTHLPLPSTSSSSSLPFGATSLVFLTNQLIAESLDVENSFLSSNLIPSNHTPTTTSDEPSPSTSKERTGREERGTKGGKGKMNDSISLEDESFEEQKNKIRDRFSRILFQ